MKNISEVQRKSAVIYVRTSSGEHKALAAQITRLSSYAREHGLHVVKVFRDHHDRVEFDTMIDFIREEGGAGLAIISDTGDRLYHRLEDVSRIDDLDAELHFVGAGRVVSEDMSSIAKLQHNLLVLVSRHLVSSQSALVSTTDDDECHHPECGFRSSRETVDHESKA